MSALAIRPATEADLAGVLALHAQPELDDGAVLSEAEARDVFRRFALYPDYVLYVAQEAGAGAIVGTYALLVMDNFGHLGARSAVVEGVAVAPDRQGAGIGAAMMRHAMAVAAEKGCYKLALSSGTRRTRAHAFYEGLGFARHGVSFHVDLPPCVPAPPPAGGGGAMSGRFGTNATTPLTPARGEGSAAGATLPHPGEGSAGDFGETGASPLTPNPSPARGEGSAVASLPPRALPGSNTDANPSPLAGEGGSRRSRETGEGCAGGMYAQVTLAHGPCAPRAASGGEIPPPPCPPPHPGAGSAGAGCEIGAFS